MATVTIVDENTLKLAVDIPDALTMIREAESDVADYAHDIVTIYDKMPEFEYRHFCFYAYNSAALFEKMLGVDPKQYLNFSLDAPDGFFYTLYGGMAALVDEARNLSIQSP